MHKYRISVNNENGHKKNAHVRNRGHTFYVQIEFFTLTIATGSYRIRVTSPL